MLDAFRTVPAHQLYLRQKVRVISAANMVDKASHQDFQMALLQFDPHVDRQDPVARAFTGDTYTFDDGRSFDLGDPTWRDSVNVALWLRVGMEFLVHDDETDRMMRHVTREALGGVVAPLIRPGAVTPAKKTPRR